jgi:hypothetical protein
LSSSGSISTVASPVVAGSYLYTLDITDGNGCSASDTVRVNVWPAVIASAGSAQTYCIPVAETITLGGAPTARGGSGNFSYSWSPGTNLSSITVANPTITTTVAGKTVYTVTVTDNITGCSAVDSMVLTINPQSTVTISSADTDICNGQSATLTAAGSPSGGTYQWSPTAAMTPAAGNVAAVSVSPSIGSQSYTVMYTASGCSSSATLTLL